VKFSKEAIRELLWTTWQEGDTIKFVDDLHVDESRWSEHRKLIFEFEGKLYAALYSRGLSETQDEAPFEYADSEIECTRVEAVEVTTIEYKPI